MTIRIAGRERSAAVHGATCKIGQARRSRPRSGAGCPGCTPAALRAADA